MASFICLRIAFDAAWTAGAGDFFVRGGRSWGVLLANRFDAQRRSAIEHDPPSGLRVDLGDHLGDTPPDLLFR